MRASTLIMLIGACAAGAAAHAASATLVDGGAIADEKQGANWLSYGRTYSENRYSPLAAINDRNVNKLGLAWFLDLPGQGTLEGTPLAVDGVLYFTGTYGITFAVDARTGRELWKWEPELASHDPQKLRLNMGAHRGLAFWKGKVYFGTNDGRLLALDARTGKVVWSAPTVEGPQAPKFISGPPRVFNGKVIIGHGNAEAGSRGYVTTYDAETGQQIWRFYTVPGDPAIEHLDPVHAMAARTWEGPPERWGGGSVWDSIVYDPDFNRIYLATGNGNPVNADARSPGRGDNLFLSSIVALDADTGKYLWHYQINPRDTWDYDSTQQLVLAEIPVDGKPRKVLMQAPKNGFFYVIDRTTGKLISAEEYTKATWAERIDVSTGRPVETANSHYEKGPVTLWPLQAHNWQPMAFDPVKQLVYIPTLKLGLRIGPPDSRIGGSSSAEGEPAGGKGLYATQFDANISFAIEDPDDGTGGLLAWDPVAQKKRWEIQYDSYWNGGTMATAGNLVFQGTARGEFIAYNATTGDRLWSFDAGLGIIAAPITYATDGVQYISLLVGYGGQAGIGTKLFDAGWRFGEQPRRLLTFALGKHTLLPRSKPPRFTVNAVDDATIAIDAQQSAQGGRVYASNFCILCHGVNLEADGSIAPDLRESKLALNWDAFKAVLHDGLLVGAGMPKYDDLSEQDLRALYMYIRQRARESVPKNVRQ